MLEFILERVPLWMVGALIVAACVLMSRLGRWLNQWTALHWPGDEKSEAEGYIIAAIFGLLSFMIGLTFSIAIDRYDARRDWVVQETNAIRTAYLRAGLFDEPAKSQIQADLRRYAHSRFAPEGLWNKDSAKQLDESRRLRMQIWDRAHVAVYPIRETDMASYFVEAVNEMLNAGALRELAGESQIPARILNSLILYLLVASIVLGFLLGDERGKLRAAAALLYVLFTISLVMILDLDRPHAGQIQVPQRALRELIDYLDRDASPNAALNVKPEGRRWRERF